MIQSAIQIISFLFIFMMMGSSAFGLDNRKGIVKKLSESPTHNSLLSLGEYLAIGSFRDFVRANKLRLRYKKKFQPEIVLVTVKGKFFYRVIVGPVKINEKKKIYKLLKDAGLKSAWFVKLGSGEKALNSKYKSKVKVTTKFKTSKIYGLSHKRKPGAIFKDNLLSKIEKKFPDNKFFKKPKKTSQTLIQKNKNVLKICDTCVKTDIQNNNTPIKENKFEKLKKKPTPILKRVISDQLHAIVVKEGLPPIRSIKPEVPVSRGSFESPKIKPRKVYESNSDVAHSRVASSFYEPGTILSDCDLCPQQVVIPPGHFVMGDEGGGLAGDAPIIKIVLHRSIAIGRFEITVAEWGACAEAGSCSSYIPKNEEWGLSNRPITNVSWNDAIEYIDWLSKRTGHKYRLPSEAEWEYSARAGSTSRFWWGDDLGINQAVCEDCGSLYDGKKPAPVGSFSANAFGLYDTAGNLWEWTQDCYSIESYKKHKIYPSPVYTKEGCSRVLRGGAWDVLSEGLQSSFRFASGSSNRSNVFGFRVVRDLD